MKAYKDKYDVIVIGGALAGLGSALSLAKAGKDVLVLEQHNLPGGVATSFVRGGFEIEASLHEMMHIGPEEAPLRIRQFFNEVGVKIDWLKVPECYRVLLPEESVDLTLHDGFERIAGEIEKACPGERAEVLRFLELGGRVYDSQGILSVTPMSKAQMLIKHPDFVKTVGYTTKEVLDTFKLSQKAKDILTPYWIYAGVPFDELPYLIFAVIVGDYFRYGSYTCRGFSHEMSLAMASRAEELGAQIEYRQRVEKILVKDGRVYGVRTARGDEIHADYVVSGAYPSRVYTSMIEPLSEVPQEAIKFVNSKKVAVTEFNVAMILEGEPEELGFKEYSIFTGTTMDTRKIMDQYSDPAMPPYEYVASVCLNMANPGCVPKGYTQLCITALPKADPWFGVTEDSYYETKRRIARGMIEEYSKFTGIDILSRIIEIEIMSPATVARYCTSWNGSVYGYMHTMRDHAVARLGMVDSDRYIQGLEFAGAHAIAGHGMGPAITNGRKAAKNILDDMASKEGR